MSPAEYARKSRAEQGLPPVVTDPAVLARLASLVRAARPTRSDETAAYS